jgi:hypothetical protein
LFATPHESPLLVASAHLSHDALARKWLARAVEQIDAMKDATEEERERWRLMRQEEAEALLKPPKP